MLLMALLKADGTCASMLLWKIGTSVSFVT
jgi:hypothetical protein